ncbi:MAG: NAD(P)-binding domain-containing protein [Thermodesulfobacteria bacterium]|nr:NAD(P)-binding domain-containing protein [Thermodesulfobacteriota bacterium]
MEKAKMVVVGAGPAGIAVAVEAKAAGIEPVVVLERSDKPCETIHKFYHPGKRVDAVYRKVKVDPIGICRFDTCSKEEFLELMDKYIKDYQLDIRYNQEVHKIERVNDCFRIHAGQDTVIEAPVVVVAIGIFGRPNRPRYVLPKEVRDRIFLGTQAEIPEHFKKVLVVGGGDSAAETACYLADKGAQVFLSYRRPKFFRINETNLAELEKRVQEGKVTLLLGTDIEGVEPAPEGVQVNFKDGQKMVFDAIFYCLGGSTPENFLRAAGVEMEGKSPKVDEYYETNVPGLFLAGDLVFEKGSIMAAFNSAHKVVEGIKKRHLDRLERGC